MNGARSRNPAAILRVALVEDDRTTRDGLAMLINDAPGYTAVGQYASVEAALAGLRSGEADVMLLDVHLPGISGPEGVLLFRERFPGTAVLMLTVYAGEDKVFESICNGAVGYLLKKTPPAKLLEAIREAATGGAPMSPEVARKVVELFRRMPVREPVEEPLTAQETRLLQLLADGHSYQAAASRLDISVNTVRSYVRTVYEKLHVHTKSEAVSKAIRRGMIV
ncbi:MAG: response regulator transcription factor [Vicinamibacterales bacterium]